MSALCWLASDGVMYAPFAAECGSGSGRVEDVSGCGCGGPQARECVRSEVFVELVDLQAEADQLCASAVSRMQTLMSAVPPSLSSQPPQSAVLSSGARSGKRRQSAGDEGVVRMQRAASQRQYGISGRRRGQCVRSQSPLSTSSTASSTSSDCSVSPSPSMASSATSTSSSALSLSSSSVGASTPQCSGPIVKERRSKLPLRAVYALRSFFTAHVSHPYPTDEQKAELARQCGLTARQVTNW